jgi:hypothetical protein
MKRVEISKSISESMLAKEPFLPLSYKHVDGSKSMLYDRFGGRMRSLQLTQPITSMDNLIVGDDVRVGFR